MTFLDTVASGVWDVLLAITTQATAADWAYPLVFIVVAGGAVLVMRTLVVPTGWLVTNALKGAMIIAAVVLLVPDWAIAAGFRKAARRPPTAVYNFGDFVAQGAEALLAVCDRAAGLIRWISRVNALLVLLAVVGLFVWWEVTHCSPGATDCARPFAAWVWALGQP